MEFYLAIAALIVLAIAIFITFIVVLVVGANLVGKATGSKGLDSPDPKVRADAMRNVGLAFAAFCVLIEAFNYLMRTLLR